MQFIGEQMGNAISRSLLEEENARLAEETADMRRQLETRKAVERAKGFSVAAPQPDRKKKPISRCEMRAAACASP